MLADLSHRFFLLEEELQVYADKFQEIGFLEELEASCKGANIRVPSKLIIADEDIGFEVGQGNLQKEIFFYTVEILVNETVGSDDGSVEIGKKFPNVLSHIEIKKNMAKQTGTKKGRGEMKGFQLQTQKEAHPDMKGEVLLQSAVVSLGNYDIAVQHAPL
ncbi:hypothetical protein L2E82_08697 [Cichorium intybus]|uniref:Uncharacterized protein n=1 Tax=Cichorium intybus TaxID=13427 RepID=A0ACB9G7W3_CICIN|nr:hypothetical protein L2E82_08697 [Cichorium intybus]